MTDEGFADAKAGKPLAELENKGYGPWDPGARAAWIYGWEGGGGDIHSRVVITERQRLETRRDNLAKELARVETRLKEIAASATGSDAK